MRNREEEIHLGICNIQQNKVNQLNIEKSLCLIVVATNQSSFADVFSTECWKSCTRELFKGTLISES